MATRIALACRQAARRGGDNDRARTCPRAQPGARRARTSGRARTLEPAPDSRWHRLAEKLAEAPARHARRAALHPRGTERWHVPQQHRDAAQRERTGQRAHRTAGGDRPPAPARADARRALARRPAHARGRTHAHSGIDPRAESVQNRRGARSGSRTQHVRSGDGPRLSRLADGRPGARHHGAMPQRLLLVCGTLFGHRRHADRRSEARAGGGIRHTARHPVAP